MINLLTLFLTCSPKMLTEQLRQQQLYIWLIAKVLRLFRSLSTLSNLLNMLTPMSALSNIAETRMDKGFHYVAHASTLIEHLCRGSLAGPSRKWERCGGQGREKALGSVTWWGGHFGVASGQWPVVKEALSGWQMEKCRRLHCVEKVIQQCTANSNQST